MARKWRAQAIGLDEALKHTACGGDAKLVRTKTAILHLRQGRRVLQENIDIGVGDSPS